MSLPIYVNHLSGSFDLLSPTHFKARVNDPQTRYHTMDLATFSSRIVLPLVLAKGCTGADGLGFADLESTLPSEHRHE
ncbi:MAG TPA: hypothetical protein VMU99_02840 [Acidimicrobiales bacterium]|nr:hypothetical protein [Acidimicrobiales bacterium]